MIALPARIAVAGDWHGNARFARRMIRAVSEGSGDPVYAIVHVGDFGLMGNDLHSFVSRVNTACRARGIEMLVIPGNHENYEWIGAQATNEEGVARIASNIRLLPRGYRFTVGDKTACAVGGAVSVDRAWRTEGETWWPGEELTDAECVAICEQEPVDYLFTHDMPTEAGGASDSDEDFVRSWGQAAAMKSWAHSARIRRISDGLTPELLVHGHMHKRYTRVHQWTSSAGQPYEVRVEGLACDGMTGKIAILDSLIPALSRSTRR